MKYPNRIIQKGEANKTIVKAIQNKLNNVGCGPLVTDGDFGNKTLSAVRLFQATRKDKSGNPLIIDGKIGAITWEALFGEASVTLVEKAPNTLLEELIATAKKEIGVTEKPLGSNGGTQVEAYLASVNLSKGNPWCAAFVYYCAQKAAAKLSKTNPLVKTGHCLTHWNNTAGKKVIMSDAVNNNGLIKVGSIFIMSFGGGRGHTGIVTKVDAGYIETIEGNSNNNGSREGIAVVTLRRKINSVQKGFIIY